MSTNVQEPICLSFNFCLNGEVSERLTYSGSEYKIYETLVGDVVILINQLCISDFTNSGCFSISDNKISIELFKDGKRVFFNLHKQFSGKRDLIEVIRELKIVHHHTS